MPMLENGFSKKHAQILSLNTFQKKMLYIDPEKIYKIIALLEALKP